MNQPKKLLIIDDDPDFVEGIKAILESANYSVCCTFANFV